MLMTIRMVDTPVALRLTILIACGLCLLPADEAYFDWEFEPQWLLFFLRYFCTLLSYRLRRLCYNEGYIIYYY